MILKRKKGLVMIINIFDWTTMLVALIGLVFVIKIFLLWDELDKSMLKAKVFLDDKFLYSNWIYLFWMGTFFIVHQATVIIYNNILPQFNNELRFISDIFELSVVVLIVIFCYRWYKLLNSCNFKD